MKKIIHTILILILTFISIINLSISEKVDFDIIEAEKLLKEAYGPIEMIAKDSSLSKDEDLLIPPDYIKNEEDFYDLLKDKMRDYEIEFYSQEFIIETEGKIFLDSHFYIPSIYSQDAEVKKAYIKKVKNLFPKLVRRNKNIEDELIIKSRWTVNEERDGRTDYFSKNEDGRWVLNGQSGTSSNGYVDIDHNPWNKYWKEK